ITQIKRLAEREQGEEKKPIGLARGGQKQLGLHGSAHYAALPLAAQPSAHGNEPGTAVSASLCSGGSLRIPSFPPRRTRIRQRRRPKRTARRRSIGRRRRPPLPLSFGPRREHHLADHGRRSPLHPPAVAPFP